MSPGRARLVVALLLCGCTQSGIFTGTTITDSGIGGGPDLLVPPDAAVVGSGIGEPCTGNGNFDQGSCADGQFCIPDGSFGNTGGYCTQQCGAASPCPSDALCAPIGGNFALCLLRCQKDSDCRQPDYSCQTVSAEGAGCFPVNVSGSLPPGTNDGGACVTPVQVPGGGDGGGFSASVQVSPGRNSLEAEGELAVDPGGSSVVVAYNKLLNSYSAIGVVVSNDDGATWNSELVLPFDKTVDKAANQSDPVVAVDPRGDFFVSWVGFNRNQSGNPTNMNVFVARASGGGPALDRVVQVTADGEAGAGQLDKPWLFASPLDGSLWLTWDRIGSQAVDIRLSRSIDGGKTWSPPVSVNDANKRASIDRNLAQTYIAADGKPAIVWVEIVAQFGSTSNAVYLQRYQPDGTAVGGGNVKVTSRPDSPTFEDPSVAVFGDAVYVGFVSGTGSGAWDVRVAASIDGGAHFLPSVKANDDPTCATHFHHQIAVDHSGNVHAIFYDNRYLQGNLFWTSSGPADANHRLAFGPNRFVNDVPFTFTTRRDQSNWLGDYPGLWIRDRQIYALWTDNRTGNKSHMFFARAPLP